MLLRCKLNQKYMKNSMWTKPNCTHIHARKTHLQNQTDKELYVYINFFLSLLAKLFIRIICCRIKRVVQLVHGIKTEQNPSYGTVKAQRIYRFSMHIYVLQQLFFVHKMGWACWNYNKPDSSVFETFTARNREQWTKKKTEPFLRQLNYMRSCYF